MRPERIIQKEAQLFLLIILLKGRRKDFGFFNC